MSGVISVAGSFGPFRQFAGQLWVVRRAPPLGIQQRFAFSTSKKPKKPIESFGGLSPTKFDPEYFLQSPAYMQTTQPVSVRKRIQSWKVAVGDEIYINSGNFSGWLGKVTKIFEAFNTLAVEPHTLLRRDLRPTNRADGRRQKLIHFSKSRNNALLREDGFFDKLNSSRESGLSEKNAKEAETTGNISHEGSWEVRYEDVVLVDPLKRLPTRTAVRQTETGELVRLSVLTGAIIPWPVMKYETPLRFSLKVPDGPKDTPPKLSLTRTYTYDIDNEQRRAARMTMTQKNYYMESM